MTGAEVLPIGGDRPALYADAVAADLTAARIGLSPKRIYPSSVTTCAWLGRGARAPARTRSLDVCRLPGRARLSYRRAAELFETATRPPANPGVTDVGELEHRGGWTLHQLRHSALTHEAEDGTNTPTLLQRSRHAS